MVDKITDDNIVINKVIADDEKLKAFEVRRKVFVEEQKVPEDIEVDGLDDLSDHYLLSLNDFAVGAARVRYIGDDVAKLERMSVLREYRGYGFGKKLVQYILNDINKLEHIKGIKLSSQVHAIPFYESMGFKICGEEYIDVGIPHQDMKYMITTGICWSI